MTTETSLQRRETLLLETMLSGLDAREAARTAEAPMLVYLAEMLVKRAREELDGVRTSLIERGSTDALKTAPRS